MDVTIVIPVRNESARISACLKAVYAQITSMRFEVMVIDSGSTDDTVEKVKCFPNVRLIHQTEMDFGHGRTRNLGAREARGSWVVFLNGDAEPEGTYWLENLVRPLRRDRTLAGVFSRHLPYPGCPLYMQRDLKRAFPPDDSIVIRTWLPRRPTHFSTVSAAVPRSLWKEHSFRDTIAIAEDQEWERRVLAAGFPILYEPRSRVFHSHHYPPSRMFRQKRDVSRSTPRFSNAWAAWLLGLPLCLGGGIVRICGDLPYVIGNLEGSAGFIIEFGRAVAARVSSFCGRFVGWLQAARGGAKRI